MVDNGNLKIPGIQDCLRQCPPDVESFTTLDFIVYVRKAGALHVWRVKTPGVLAAAFGGEPEAGKELGELSFPDRPFSPGFTAAHFLPVFTK